MSHASTRLSSFALVCLTFITLLSCNANYGKQDPDPNNSNNEKGKYLRLSVHRPSKVILRATHRDPLTEIKQIYFLFYDQSNHNLKYIREGRSASDRSLSKVDVKLPAGDYDLVVIANPTEKLRPYLSVGSPLSLLTEAQALSRSAFLGADNSIVMANEQGPIHIERSQFVDNPHESVSTPINITIEPALARVLVYGNPEIRVGTRGSAEAKYCVNNLLKKVPVLRMLNKLSTGAMEVSGDNSPREQRYAKSSIWDSWSHALPSNTEEVASFSTEHLRANQMDGKVYPSLGDFEEDIQTASYLYVKESPIPETAYLVGVVPYVHLAFPYIPAGLTLTDGEGWLSYRGQFYAEHTFIEMIQNNTFPSPELQELVTRQGITENKLSSSEAGFSIDGLNFHYQAYSYYAIPITHFSKDDYRPTYGSYGLVRGNEYRIRLVGVTSAGSPTPITYQNDLSPLATDRSLSFNTLVAEVTARSSDVSL